MKMFIALMLSIAAFSASANQVQLYKIACSSKGYSADSVTNAIALCKEIGNYNERDCARTISCNAYQAFCSSRGFAGDNIAEAVQRCVELGRHQQKDCLRSVSCR